MSSSAILWRRLLIVAVTAALVTATVAALCRLRAPSEPPPERTATVTGEPPAPTTAAPCAYLGEWEGRLAVFRAENAAPQEVYDVFVQTLPSADRQAIAARIPVYTEEELQGLLEDYTG